MVAAAGPFLLVLIGGIFLVRRERNADGYIIGTLLAVTGAVDLCDRAAVTFPSAFGGWKSAAVVLESLYFPLWLLFSFVHCRKVNTLHVGQKTALALSAALSAAVILFLPASSLFYSPDFAAEQLLFLERPGFWLYAVMILFLTFALLALEGTLRGSSGIDHWKIKLRTIGTGMLIISLIFFYGQALLYRAIDMVLLPVRTVVLLVATALIVYSRLRRGAAPRIHVSRDLLSRSLALWAVASYLLVLGLIGHGMNYVDDSSQKVLPIAAGFMVGGVLVGGLLSRTVRRKAMLFINRNFYREKYDYRAQWLKFTEGLAGANWGEGTIGSMLGGFCDTFGMGRGALYALRGNGRSYRRACAPGFEELPEEFSSTASLVKWVEKSSGPMTLGTARHGLPQGSFVIPLPIDQRLEGFIIMADPVTSEDYTCDDYDLMKVMACQTSSLLLNLRLSDELLRSREMEAVGKVSAFVVHDLKNLTHSLSMLLDNAKLYLNDPDFRRDLLQSVSATVVKMKKMIARLRGLPDKHELRRTPTNLLEVMQETASMVGGVIRVEGTPVVAEVDKDELQKVALNLLINAVEAGGSAAVEVEVGEKEGAFISVHDDGCGMSEEFLRNSLFAPFRSTKASGLGIGLYQSRQIVEQHGGRISVCSRPDKGSVFTVWLPKGAA